VWQDAKQWSTLVEQTLLLTTASSALLHSQSGLTNFSNWPRIRTSSITILTNFFRFSWVFNGSGKLPGTSTGNNNQISQKQSLIATLSSNVFDNNWFNIDLVYILVIHFSIIADQHHLSMTSNDGGNYRLYTDVVQPLQWKHATLACVSLRNIPSQQNQQKMIKCHTTDAHIIFIQFLSNFLFVFYLVLQWLQTNIQDLKDWMKTFGDGLAPLVWSHSWSWQSVTDLGVVHPFYTVPKKRHWCYTL